MENMQPTQRVFFFLSGVVRGRRFSAAHFVSLVAQCPVRRHTIAHVDFFCSFSLSSSLSTYFFVTCSAIMIFHDFLPRHLILGARSLHLVCLGARGLESPHVTRVPLEHLTGQISATCAALSHITQDVCSVLELVQF